MVISFKKHGVIRHGVAWGRPAPAHGPNPWAVAGAHGGAYAGRPWVRPAYRRRALRRRRLLYRLLAALSLVAVAATAWQLATRMDSVVVLPRSEMPSVPTYFYQEDPAWSADRMGGSDRTLGKDGDGVACLASLMAMQGLSAPLDGALNPGTLNAWLGASGAYDAQGNLNWGRVAKLLGVKHVQRHARRGLGKQLEKLLKREVYAIVTVRRPDTGRDHDVLVVGSVHGEYVILDPLDPTDTPNTLGLYGNRISGMRYFE